MCLHTLHVELYTTNDMYTCLQNYIHARVCVRVCVRERGSACVCVCAHLYIFVHMCVYMHLYKLYA